MSNFVKPPERQKTMRLHDNRSLAWYQWGPINGIPVLFCTGAGMSGTLGFGVNCLAELGLKLIAIDRPGLGLSDPHPNKTFDSWVDDTQELIQANDLYNVLVVGFSQGAPFGFALAECSFVKVIAIVSGQDELTHPRLKPLLQENRFMEETSELVTELLTLSHNKRKCYQQGQRAVRLILSAS